MERPRAGGAAALPPPLGLPLLAAGWGDARGDSAMPSAPLLVQPRGSVQLKQQAQQTVPPLLTLPSWPAWVAVDDAAAAAPKHHAACAVAFCDVRPGACSSDSSPRLNAVAVLAAAAPHTEQPAPVPQHFQLPPHRMPAKQSGQQYKLQLPWERAPLSAVTMQQPHHSCSDAAPNHDGGGRASPATCCGEQRPPPGLRALGRAINGEAGKLLGLVGAQLLLHAANLQRGMAALQQQKQLERQLESGGEAQHLQRPHGLAGWRPRFPWQRPAGPGGATDSAAAAAASSAGAWHARDAAQQWVVRGVAAEANMDLRTALACYTNAVTLVPGDSALLCRLAKQWSDLTYEPGASVEAIQEVNTKAAEYAQRAITLAPQARRHSCARLPLYVTTNRENCTSTSLAATLSHASCHVHDAHDLCLHLSLYLSHQRDLEPGVCAHALAPLACSTLPSAPFLSANALAHVLHACLSISLQQRSPSFPLTLAS